MFGKKKLSRPIWSVIISFFLLFSCSESKTDSINGFEVVGESQGTTYTIIIAEEKLNFSKVEIDNILAEFDTILSTYIPSSAISRINNSVNSFRFLDNNGYFKNCYQASELVFSESKGAFDPSVFPLVEGWGFFKKLETPLSAEKVDSILAFTSFEKYKFHKVEFRSDSVFFMKMDPRFKLDFNAIAQGYAVDVIHDFIKSKGHTNFYIELGGELRVSGKNREGLDWNIGIDAPEEINANSKERKISGVLSLTNKAIATSGNYRNFYEKDGKKYAHTLNPKTGYPVQHNLLSATVIANNCALADGFATAFMVMGLEESKKYLSQSSIPLEVVFIYQNQKGSLDFFTTPGAKKMLE